MMDPLIAVPDKNIVMGLDCDTVCPSLYTCTRISNSDLTGVVCDTRIIVVVCLENPQQHLLVGK